MYCGYALGRRGKLFAQIINPESSLSSHKIWGVQCKGNIFKFEVKWGGKKCAFFNEKLAYLKNGEREPRLLLITNRIWHMPFQIR